MSRSFSEASEAPKDRPVSGAPGPASWCAAPGIGRGTLHAHLLAQNPRVARAVVGKPAMVQTSRLLERVAAADGQDAVLAAAFQYELYWLGAYDRYADIEAQAIVLAVPARHHAPPPREGVSLVALPESHPFVSEWFVVALGPTVSVLLCGLDLHYVRGSGPIQAGRTFDVILSTDPKLAHEALAFIANDPALPLPAEAVTALGGAGGRGRREWKSRREQRSGLTDHVLSAMLQQADELEQKRSAAADRRDRELVEVRDRERRRMVEAVHDGSLQHLIAAAQDLAEIDVEGHHREELRLARETLKEGVGRLRDEIFGAHRSPSPDDLATRLVALSERHGRRGGFVPSITVDPAATGDQDEQIVACVRELLTNAAKHAHANTVNVSIRRTATPSQIVIDVTDDGVGVSAQSLAEARAEGHLGLDLASTRVREAGGTWTLTSTPNKGLSVRATLPTVAWPKPSPKPT